MPLRVAKRTLYITLGIFVVSMWLLIWALATGANAAELSDWKLESLSQGNYHTGCTATRIVDRTQFVEIKLSKKGKATLTISGVNFDITSRYADTGLMQLDDMAPMPSYVTYHTQWRTSFSVPDGEAAAPLLAKAKVLRVLAGERVYAIDLKGSYQAVQDLKECNDSGQTRLNRRRMSEAKPAHVRVG